MDEEFSNEDLRKGMWVFLMCFGQGLPDTLKASIQQRTYSVAEQIDLGGEPSVANIARGFADALVAKTLPTMH